MNNKILMFLILSLAVLFTFGCTANKNIPESQIISFDFLGEKSARSLSANVESIDMIDLLSFANIKDSDNYVYTIIGDRTSTITYDEIKYGQIITKDKSTKFDLVMCDCTGIKNVSMIKIEKKRIIILEDKQFIIKNDIKTFIIEYITKTPNAYSYKVNEEIKEWGQLSNDLESIEMIRPANYFELRIGFDNPTFLFTENKLKEIILNVTKTPNDYKYIFQNKTYSYDELLEINIGKITLIRSVIHIKNGNVTKDMALSITEDTIFTDMITDSDKENYTYKFLSSEGFSPKEISWNDFKTGSWSASKQRMILSSISSAKYSIRDLAVIEMIKVEAHDTTAQEIIIKDVLPTLSKITYEGSEAVVLSDFIKVTNPELYDYKVAAADGYSPEAFTYEDMQKGYLMIAKKETLFTTKNIGKNRIRDPAIIKLIAKQ